MRRTAARPPDRATTWLLLLVAAGAACTADATAAGKATPPATAAPGSSPLPSWNPGGARTAILAFVARVTDPRNPDFVPEPRRIAVFDNDGTLWVEQPLYFEGMFTIDRARAMAAADPKLRSRSAFQKILQDDGKALGHLSEPEIGALLAATHAGMSHEDLVSTVQGWLAGARHPRFDRPLTACVYRPQLELLALLRANGFKTFLVSGGGVDFMRAFSEQTYGIPPEQVVGSAGKTRFAAHEGKGDLVKLDQLQTIDDKVGKPININLHIGRRPILAFGNSDGDLEMLEYTAGGDGPHLLMLLHHDDAEREYAYDRASRIGKLDRALDEAAEHGWLVVSMRKDFKVVFP